MVGIQGSCEQREATYTDGMTISQTQTRGFLEKNMRPVPELDRSVNSSIYQSMVILSTCKTVGQPDRNESSA